MKSALLYLSGIVAVATFVILILYWLANEKRNIKHGFNRHVIKRDIPFARSVTLDSDLYYFAGWMGDKVYLANPDIPLAVLAIHDTVQQVIPIQNLTGVKASRISIDSPYFYLSDLYSYTIYKGNSSSWTVDKTIHNRIFFSESLPISTTSTVLRTFNHDRTTYQLSKENIHHEKPMNAPGLLQKQIDGLFCTDGMLLFDKGKHRILYTYYYRNEFICADTNLVLLYRGKTIDTVSRANIKVEKISSMGISTLASPPAVVNRATYAAEGKLYINSNLIADNEDSNAFKSSDVVDLYDTTTGKYLFSFYLPKSGNQRMRHFAIHGGRLFVLRGQRLDIYRMTN